MGWDNPFEGRTFRREPEKIPSTKARAWLIQNFGEPRLIKIENINQSRNDQENDVEISEGWDLLEHPGHKTISISWFKEANFKVETFEIGLEEVQQACAERVRLYTAMYKRWDEEAAEEAAKYLPSGKLKPIKKSK
jgi:hypothetical protein